MAKSSSEKTESPSQLIDARDPAGLFNASLEGNTRRAIE